jgi:transposase-like protein
LKVKTKTTKCPHCANTDLDISGIRRTLSGDVKRYQCKKCGKYFSFGPKTRRINYGAGTIFTALHMERNFYTSRQISEFLLKVHQVNVTHEMVSKWSRNVREIINKDHDHWQRALKNPDKALHTLAEIIVKTWNSQYGILV